MSDELWLRRGRLLEQYTAKLQLLYGLNNLSLVLYPAVIILHPDAVLFGTDAKRTDLGGCNC